MARRLLLVVLVALLGCSGAAQAQPTLYAAEAQLRMRDLQATAWTADLSTALILGMRSAPRRHGAVSLTPPLSSAAAARGWPCR